MSWQTWAALTGLALVALLWTYARSWRRRHPKRDYNHMRSEDGR